MRIQKVGLSALMPALALAGCAKPALELPKDPAERAATCYAAKIAQFSAEKGPNHLTVEQTNEAAHFLLLGASSNGVAEPTKAKTLAQRGQAIEPEITKAKNAAAYAEPCAKAYPQTGATAFKGLPADSADTRMMCYALVNAMIQIYRASDVPPGEKGPRYGALYAELDTRITNEVNAAAGEPNIAEIAGRAMRGLALGAEAGPPTQVLDACAARYLPKDAAS